MSICLLMNLSSSKRASSRKFCNKLCRSSRLSDMFISEIVYSLTCSSLISPNVFINIIYYQFRSVRLRLRHGLAHSRQSPSPSTRSIWELRRWQSVSIRPFRGLESWILCRMSVNQKMSGPNRPFLQLYSKCSYLNRTAGCSDAHFTLLDFGRIGSNPIRSVYITSWMCDPRWINKNKI